jgi:periplasmic copper chaperone A
LHLMFFDVAETFKDGDMVPVTLTFEKAGKVELMLPVMAKAMNH